MSKIYTFSIQLDPAGPNDPASIISSPSPFTFTALNIISSFKENSRKVIVGGVNLLMEIDTTIGSESVTMTFSGISGEFNRIFCLEGTNYFLVGGTSRILYKFDRTIAAPRAQTP